MGGIARWLLAASLFGGCCAVAGAQDTALIEAGELLYDENCAGCHGEKVRAPSSAFDLRTLGPQERARFDKVVMEGKGQMPTWRGIISPDGLDQLWAYIQSRGNRGG
jgi:mono/diheme cytochrome c family protein